ncbi:MAG TPA: TIGR02266 family protein [Polyangiaceae bacterium]|jgi:type IV pilus assembly protein PilZ|nr:TIGR02266 family protein [Polyangiaceae bacterium]
MPTNKDSGYSSMDAGVGIESDDALVSSGSDGDSDTGADRRRFPRHAITLRVDYKRMNTFFADYAKNISKGGTFIRTSKPLDAGTEFVFVLSIPGQADQLQLLGQVMWTVDEGSATEEHPAGMGIRFKFANAEELRELEDFVAKLMSEKLGSHVAAKLLGTHG